ncbi:hypothetical protein B194_0044 [Serratia plymuthica A30]|nr:hypothetical protein B194_0044 [Serratia plymuthica A30]
MLISITKKTRVQQYQSVLVVYTTGSNAIQHQERKTNNFVTLSNDRVKEVDNKNIENNNI